MLVRLTTCLWKQLMYYLLFGMKMYSFFKLLKKHYEKKFSALIKKFIELKKQTTIYLEGYSFIGHSTIIKHIIHREILLLCQLS